MAMSPPCRQWMLTAQWWGWAADRQLPTRVCSCVIKAIKKVMEYSDCKYEYWRNIKIDESKERNSKQFCGAPLWPCICMCVTGLPVWLLCYWWMTLFINAILIYFFFSLDIYFSEENELRNHYRSISRAISE